MSNPPCVADIVQPLAVDDWVSEPGRHQDTSRRQARRYLLAEPSHRYDGVNDSTLRRRPRPLNLRSLPGGPTFISRTVTHRRLDRRYLVTHDPSQNFEWDARLARAPIFHATGVCTCPGASIPTPTR